ncbi:tetratricopeptide repeat protein, partial [Micromonospora sp. NPDC000018]|uniref:tetratricopeptide repeat protein n=1 Tax=Micromonospora sp. NPDC000018 TaxID=3154239 RepID=UPI00331D2F4A
MTAPEGQLARVVHLLEINRPEQALDEVHRLPAALAATPAAFRLRASALTALERWDGVLAVARQGLAETGPDAELLGHLGLSLRHRREYAPAERALLDGLAIEPDNAWLLCQYAYLCCEVGQIDKADRLVARAAAITPDAPAVFATRFQVAYSRGDDRAAERIAEEFLGAWPGDPAALGLEAMAQVATALAGLTDAMSTAITVGLHAG